MNIVKDAVVIFGVIMISVVILWPLDTVLAREVKVYLSEGLGAGEEVYHVTQCTKMPKLVPLRCTNQNASEFRNQCISIKEDKTEKVLLNQYIKICRKDKDRISADMPNVAGSAAMIRARAKTVDLSKCPKTDQQDFVVESVWAVYRCADGSKNCEAKDMTGGPKEKAIGNDENGKPVYYKFGKRVVLGTIVQSGEPDKTEKGEELAEAFPGFVGVARIYEIGQERDSAGAAKEGGQKACEEADYYVAGDKQNEAIDGGNNIGSMPQMFTDSCTSYNSSFIGDGRPIWTCSRGERITGTSGTDLISKFVGALYRWLASIIGIISVLVMVASGIEISMAQDGSAGGMEAAKKRILGSIIGLVVLFLSGLILYTINPTFFVQ